MKYRKQDGLVTQPEISDISKTEVMFVEPNSALRNSISSKDAITHRDIMGICSYLLAKGHTKQLYGMIADVKISH
jgi:hypothetical protein